MSKILRNNNTLRFRLKNVIYVMLTSRFSRFTRDRCPFISQYKQKRALQSLNKYHISKESQELTIFHEIVSICVACKQNCFSSLPLPPSV